MDNKTLYSDNVEYATIVYSMNASSNERAIYFQLWDKGMNLLFEDDSNSPTSAVNLGSVQAISYNGTLVNDLHLYSGVLDSSASAVNLAYSMLTIPEPATSILCGLALVMFVARRRR